MSDGLMYLPGPDQRFWVVTDPTPQSKLVDILFETTWKGLAIQFFGGLTMEQHPTLFFSHDEASEEANRRLAKIERA